MEMQDSKLESSNTPDELGAGAARAQPIPILHSFLLLFLCHFLEITKRIPGLD
jgi:hypothetical protein